MADLLAGKVASCGCLWRQKITTGRQGTENPNFRHGLHWRSYPLYNTWQGMLSRCENPDGKMYANYGGRGITVCDRWHDVQLFAEDIDRLIGPRPAGHSIDRIDNDGGYEPGNVRWATAKEQRANQRPYGSGALATVKRQKLTA